MRRRFSPSPYFGPPKLLTTSRCSFTYDFFPGRERAWTAPGDSCRCYLPDASLLYADFSSNPDFFRTNSFNSGRVFALSSAITHTMRHLRKIPAGNRPEVINNLLTTTPLFARGATLHNLVWILQYFKWKKTSF